MYYNNLKKQMLHIIFLAFKSSENETSQTIVKHSLFNRIYNYTQLLLLVFHSSRYSYERAVVWSFTMPETVTDFT
jgi:hypothetical protein